MSDPAPVLAVYDARDFADELYWPPSPAALRVIPDAASDPDAGKALFAAGGSVVYPLVIDERSERLGELADLTSALPSSQDYVETTVRTFNYQIVVIGPAAVQRDYAKLLKTIRRPADGAFQTLVVDGKKIIGPSRRQDPRAPLDTLLPEVAFDEIGFEVAIDRLALAAHANIIVDWQELGAAGFDRTTPVKLRLWQASLSNALAAVLQTVGGQQSNSLDFRIDDDGMIYVSTADALSRGGGVLRVYDIRALLRPMAEPDMAIFAPGSFLADVDQSWILQTRKDALEFVTMLLKESVDPDSWRDNGGTGSHLREWGGRLFVLTSPSNQSKIATLLQTLADEFVGSVENPSTRPATRPSLGGN